MNRFIIIPVKEKHLGGIYLSGYQTIPVLCYHKFNEKDDSKLNISKQAFEEQIKYLKDNEFRSITLKALLDFFEYKKEIPEKSVLITIDDGFKSGYDVACQILLKYGFKAVFFIYTDYVGVSGKAMTWENLRELKKNGFEIGSHTLSHCDLTEQFQGESEEAYQKRIKREIWMSKKIIDKKLNQNTVSFSFPYGKSNPEVVDYVRSAGYKMGFTVTQGSNPFFSDTFTLKRYMILNSNKESFISKLRVFQPLY
ncbi:MAG: polysaccharide deacetylase family protein [Desulfobacteraceae bacterium]